MFIGTVTRFAPFRRLSPVLTFLGNRLGINAHYFFRGSMLQSTSFAVHTVRGFVAGYLVARLLPQETYGEYRFILLCVGVAASFCLPNLASAIGIWVAREKERAPVRHALVLYTFVCIAGAGAIMAIIPFLSLWEREPLAVLFALAAVLFVPKQVFHIFLEGITTGLGRFGLGLTSNIITSTLIIMGTLAVLFTTKSVAALLAITMGIPGIIGAWYVLSLLRRFPDKRTANDMMRYGTVLTVNGLPVSLAWYLDGLFISLFFGMNELAVFSIVTLIPEQLKAFSKSLLPVTLSRQAKGTDSPERRKKLKRITLTLCGVFLVMIILYGIAAPHAMPLLFPQYAAGVIAPLTALYALTLVFTPTNLLTQYMESQHMAHVLRKIQLVSSAIYVASFAVLIPAFGIVGAIAARGIFRVVIVMLVWHALGSNTVTPLRSESRG